MTTVQAMLVGAILAWTPSLVVFLYIVRDMRNHPARTSISMKSSGGGLPATIPGHVADPLFAFLVAPSSRRAVRASQEDGEPASGSQNLVIGSSVSPLRNARSGAVSL